MHLSDWVGVAVGIISVLASIAASLRWLIKSYLKELVPNNGGSMKDKVDRLELRVDQIYTLLLEKN